MPFVIMGVTVIMTTEEILIHYGVSVRDGSPGRGSGRYPLGSGKDPKNKKYRMLKTYERYEKKFLKYDIKMDPKLRKKGRWLFELAKKQTSRYAYLTRMYEPGWYRILQQNPNGYHVPIRD